MAFGYAVLLTAITLSLVSAYYSVMGLATIFAGSGWPIIIMGSALETAKIMTAVWLHINWKHSGLGYKLYLVPALVVLMMLTSIGVFGLLSKSHLDSGVSAGDVQSKIAIYDEKIKTEKENIEANRKALKQMDEGVDQVLGRSTDEKGADKAVALRRTQQKERARLQAEISQSQQSIQELNSARAPIAAEVRKIEAEVGPIKYVAALIYGDNPDTNVLERAVRWVIILIVAVFDPLAIVLILAGSKHIEWQRQLSSAKPSDPAVEEFFKTVVAAEPTPGAEPELIKPAPKKGTRTKKSKQSLQLTTPDIKIDPTKTWVLIDKVKIDPTAPVKVDVKKTQDLANVLNTSAASKVEETTLAASKQETTTPKVKQKKAKTRKGWFPETRK